MEEEDLLEMAEALLEVDGLSGSEEKLVEKIVGILKEEKPLPKKLREQLTELHKEHQGEKEKKVDEDEVDEDDFV